MVSAASLVSVGADAGVVALLAWTTWAAYQSWEKPSARPFVGMLGTLTGWALFEFGSELPVSTPLSGLWDVAQFCCAVFVPGLWLLYVLNYTGRGTELTWKRTAMLGGIALPIVLLGVLIAFRPGEAVFKRVFASLLGTEFLYVFVLFLYATYLFVGHGRRHDRISNLQLAVVIGGVTAPYLVGGAGDSGAALDSVTGGLFLAGGLLAVAIRQYPVLTGFPRANYVARTRVVERLREAVVVLDWDDFVIDANQTTAELFGRSPEAMIGEPIRSVADGLDGRDLSAGATGSVTLQTTKGRRQFQYSVSAVDEETPGGDSDAAPVARAVLFRDVTDQQTREQRLTVLNRILRHNVRNELDIVLAHAERVEDEQLRDGISDSASDLVTLSNKAREAEEVMTATTEPPSPVDLTSVVRTVTDEYRTANPEADISLSCPDELILSSHRTVLEQVLSELLDNALTHTVEGTPQVEVSLREDAGGAVELTVADNGPGIPDREREILADGTETQLEHGQGIGLWFVNWAVSQLGGDLRFGENDPAGTVVTVRLYDTRRGPT
jgi:signal transduction histidine kinase